MRHLDEFRRLEADLRETGPILALAPSPEAGRRLSQSKIAAALRRAGRQRGIEASAEQIQAALRAPQLEAHPGVVSAYAAAVRSLVAVIDALVTPAEVLRAEVEAGLAGTRTSSMSRQAHCRPPC